MVRQIFLSLFLLFSLFSLTAQTIQSDTLLSVSKAGSISITSTSSSTSITIWNLDGGSDNFYYQTGRQKSKGAISETRINYPHIKSPVVVETDHNVTVSFITPEGNDQVFTYEFPDAENRSSKSYIGSKGSDFGFTISRTKTTKWEMISEGIGLGWVTPTKACPDMDVSMWKSNELTWEMILGVRMTHRAHTLAMGLGIDWQNFVTKGNRYFHKETDGRITLRPYEEGMTDTRSRIKIFSLQIPVLYGFSFGHHRDLGIKIGPVLNFNTSASISTKYKLEGREYSVKTNNIGQRPVTVDGMFQFRYKAVCLYARYSPMKKLRDRTELEFGSFSTGIMIGF